MWLERGGGDHQKGGGSASVGLPNKFLGASAKKQKKDGEEKRGD